MCICVHVVVCAYMGPGMQKVEDNLCYPSSDTGITCVTFRGRVFHCNETHRRLGWLAGKFPDILLLYLFSTRITVVSYHTSWFTLILGLELSTCAYMASTWPTEPLSQLLLADSSVILCNPFQRAGFSVREVVEIYLMPHRKLGSEKAEPQISCL